MVPEAGLEPARPHQTLDFESNASTDSTIRAWYFCWIEQKRVALYKGDTPLFNTETPAG